MSSTSSSECVCAECFNYGPGPGFTSPGFRPRAPYYQTLGHPLVYYAQVQQTPYSRRRNRESRQGSPNCFVKAFRWYTQERYQSQNPQNRELPNDRTDLNGFAVWLDKKYDEFMLDKQGEQNAFQVQPQRPSTVETSRNSTSVVCDMPLKKKFARVKSPWGRRRRNSREGGDIIEKAPRNRSNVSSETQASKKTIVKSYSSDRIDYEKANNTPIEVINHEGNVSKLSSSKSEIQPQTAPQTVSKEFKDELCQCPEEKIEVTDVEVQCNIIDRELLIESTKNSDDKNTTVTKENKQVPCFCTHEQQTPFTDERSEECQAFSRGFPETRGDEDGSEPKKYRESKASIIIGRSQTNFSCPYSGVVARNNAQTQYTHDNQYLEAVCGCCICDEYKILSRASSSHQHHPRMLLPPCQYVKYPKILDLQQTSNTTKDTGTDVGATASKIVPITFASGAVQTSDHSICLDKNTYPLFMKIVRADKLGEEFIRM